MNNHKLSDRMSVIAGMVINGESVADVGTDHGFIPIALLLGGAVPFAVMSDVNEGPLEIAKKHLDEAGLCEDQYSLRLGSGMTVLENAEVSSVIIAGMGGELIENLLDEDPEKARSFKRLILQPRTHSDELRYYLSQNSFKIVDYKLVKEKGRICEVYAAEPVDFGSVNNNQSLISDFLINNKDPLLCEFVDYKIHCIDVILQSISNSKTEDLSNDIKLWKSMREELIAVKSKI